MQFACRIGNLQDALVGGLLVSGSRITAVTEVAGQTGRLVGRCDPVLVIRMEFSVLYVEIGIAVAVNTAVARSGARKKNGCENRTVERSSWNCMLHL